MDGSQIAQMVVTWEGTAVKSVEFPKLGIVTEARIEQALPAVYRALRVARIEERKIPQVAEAAKTQE